MNIPKYIKDKMHKLSNLTYRTYKLSQEIDDWFILNGYDIHKLRSGNGISLEELEYGNDIVDKFCKWFDEENDDLRR